MSCSSRENMSHGRSDLLLMILWTVKKKLQGTKTKNTLVSDEKNVVLINIFL